jgi:cytochrome b561
VGGIHADISKVVLWIIIAGHIAGALAHHFYWKPVLKRMTIG